MGARADGEIIRAVVDTGPLLHLAEADAGFLFRRLLDAVCPFSVVEELERHSPGRWRICEQQGRIRANSLGDEANAQSQAWQMAGLLDRGEADALALAQELGIDCLITDDAAARLLAGSLGLTVRGSLGLVLEAARLGVLNLCEAKTKLAALRDSSLWVSERVYAEAQRLLDEIPE